MKFICYSLIGLGAFFTYAMYAMWRHWKNQDEIIKELNVDEKGYNEYMKDLLKKIMACYALAIVIKLFL